MEIQKGFTQAEWEQVLRLNETDPKEAVKRFLAGISDPMAKQRSNYPNVKLDRMEYNLGVSLFDEGHFEQTINYFIGLMCERLENAGTLVRLNLIGRKKQVKEKPKINLYVKFYNCGVNPLNPMSFNDRPAGTEYPFVNPGDSYEGYVFFPYLAAWLRSGRKARLVGV